MKLQTIIIVILALAILVVVISYAAYTQSISSDRFDPRPNHMMHQNNGSVRHTPPPIPTPFYDSG